MAQIKGYDGQVDWGIIVDSDSAYRTHSWGIDITADTHDITDFTSTGWREFLGGLKSWSGTIEMYTDTNNRIVPSDVGSTATLTLYFDGSDYLKGKAICTGWHPATSVDGVETQTLDFQGTSDLWYGG